MDRPGHGGAPQQAPKRQIAFDLTTLRLLLTAVDEGNLAKAAARENISTSAVSRRIADLEVRLGVKLLRRHDRGVTATEPAQMVLGRIRSIFQLLEQIGDDLNQVRCGLKGVIRLQAHLTAITGVLPNLAARFMAEHPGLEVRIVDATSAEILHAVEVGDCDLGLVSGTVAADGVDLIPWGADQLVAVLPAGHPLEKLDVLRFSDLIDHPFVGMSPNSSLQTLCRGQAAAVGRSLHERALVNSFEGVRALVEAGLGVGVLPAGLAATTGKLAVRPLAEPWASRPLMICVRDVLEAGMATRLFIDWLLSMSSDRVAQAASQA